MDRWPVQNAESPMVLRNIKQPQIEDSLFALPLPCPLLSVFCSLLHELFIHFSIEYCLHYRVLPPFCLTHTTTKTKATPPPPRATKSQTDLTIWQLPESVRVPGESLTGHQVTGNVCIHLCCSIFLMLFLFFIFESKPLLYSQHWPQAGDPPASCAAYCWDSGVCHYAGMVF